MMLMICEHLRLHFIQTKAGISLLCGGVSLKWDKHSEEVWSNAGGDQQADLTSQQAERGAAQPAAALRNRDGIKRLRNYGSHQETKEEASPDFYLRWHSYNWRS